MKHVQNRLIGIIVVLLLVCLVGNMDRAEAASNDFESKTTLKYQWQAKAPGSTTWSKSSQSGATTSKLSVATTMNHNGYQYRCVVTDGNGNQATSNAVTLTVQ